MIPISCKASYANSVTVTYHLKHSHTFHLTHWSELQERRGGRTGHLTILPSYFRRGGEGDQAILLSYHLTILFQERRGGRPGCLSATHPGARGKRIDVVGKLSIVTCSVVSLSFRYRLEGWCAEGIFYMFEVKDDINWKSFYTLKCPFWGKCNKKCDKADFWLHKFKIIPF